MPLLFWVTGNGDQDNDDLNDSQEECFRDPTVVDIVERRFVPVRVARNSRVMEAAERLGLPTEFGLYCAVLTTEGRLLDSMGPAEVADPVAFAHHLAQASTRYLDALFQSQLRPILEDPTSPKPQVRLAAQTVWRLGTRSADSAIISLLDRPDLTGSERSRLYSLVASFGSEAGVGALLSRADDKQAAAALLSAEPTALEWLIPALPGSDGEVSPSHRAAYRAVVQICRLSGPKPDQWWVTASPEDRRRELDRVTQRAETILDYSKQRQTAGS